MREKAIDFDAFMAEVMNDPLVYDIWDRKYRYKLADGSSPEADVRATRMRVVNGVYVNDPSSPARIAAMDAVQRGLFVPAGRVNAGAGTNNNVTLINCFISETIQDSMPGIQRAIMRGALTLQGTGGLGTDWSPVRPYEALVRGSLSDACGVIPFMDQMDAMCRTIAVNDRRGALMATLRDDHPDLWNPRQFETTINHVGDSVLKFPSFISVKRQKGRLTQCNMSILVSNALVAAIDADADWDLGFHLPRKDGQHVDVYDKPLPHDIYDDDNEIISVPGQPNNVTYAPLKHAKGTVMPWYVYRRVKAREIWDDIMRSTYVYAEPGVIYIDRINERNSLYYCEDIRCTNPCFDSETLIVTDEGAKPIKSLVGKKVRMFDGDDWRVVDNFRRTGVNQPMLRFDMQDGSFLRVTPAHMMKLEDGTRKRADQIVKGDRFKLHDMHYHGNVSEDGAYLKGFLIGDGSVKRTREPKLAIYPPKYGCIDRLMESVNEIRLDETIHHNTHADIGFTHRLLGRQERKDMEGLSARQDALADWCTTYKTGLPIAAFSWDRESKVEFLAGLFDADGNVKDGKNGFGYQMSSVSRDLLLDVQTLLKSIGVRSKVAIMKQAGMKDMPGGSYMTQDCWRLNIAQASSIIMSKALRFSRLSSFADRVPAYSMASNAGKVESVREDGVDAEVFCCTVDPSHSVALAIGLTTYNCGEKPMPPDGICALSAINAAFLVEEPFTKHAEFNFDKWSDLADLGVQFIDNVLDVSRYPLASQRAEAMAKRRIGLGVLGWGSALVQLGVPYGSPRSVELSRHAAALLQERSYFTSAMLAKERGPFPMYDREKFMKGYNFKKLPGYVKSAIAEYGIRNGELNTIAPNGTGSGYTGNVSSAHEPVFSFEPMTRKMRQRDNSVKPYRSVDYSLRLYEKMFGEVPMRDGKLDRTKLRVGFVDAMTISVDDHLAVHAAWHEFIDASISKTVNVPYEMSFDDFKQVYSQAYVMGAKGCTTYRPDPIAGRGSVLSVDVPATLTVDKPVDAVEKPAVPFISISVRPGVLGGMTYKLKWPVTGKNWYVTVTSTNGQPQEIFITPGDPAAMEWVAALSRTVTAVLRRGGDVRFLVDQLEEVHSAAGGAFIADQQAYRPSIVAAIAGVMRQEFRRLGLYSQDSCTQVPVVEEPRMRMGAPRAGMPDDGTVITVHDFRPLMNAEDVAVLVDAGLQIGNGIHCPQCHQNTYIKEGGCGRCLNCDYTTCG